MARKKAKKAKRTFTKKHRAKLSAAAARRHAKRRAEMPAAADAAGGKKRKIIRSHEGVRVLMRNGGGKDILQGDAEAVIRAMRAVKILCRLV